MGAQITVADNAGFCFGVKRAINMALNVRPCDGSQTYILGALVHNPVVTTELTRQGFVTVDTCDEVLSGRVVLPSHGVAPSIRWSLVARGIEIVDATCPFVATAQREVERLSRLGRRVIIAGDRGHGEVVGLAGHSSGDVEVVSNVTEAIEVTHRLPSDTPVAVVAQTTQDRTTFRQIVEIIERHFRDTEVSDTICTATRDRQQGVIDLAPVVDMMIVVGGRNSANTRRLCEISRALGKETYLIESADELDEVIVANGSRVGIAAGASTPGWAIKEVVSKMEEKTKGLNAGIETAPSDNTEPTQGGTGGAKQVPQSTGPENASLPQEGVDSQQTAGGPSGSSDEAVPGKTTDGGLGSGKAVADVESTPESNQGEGSQEPDDADMISMSEALASEYIPQEGEIVKGTVVQVNDDDVRVDIGYKSEAVIRKRELSVRPVGHPSEVVSVGDEIQCVVLSVKAESEKEAEGAVEVSKKRADLISAWERVEKAYNEGKPIQGKVVDVVKGGVTVDIGLRGFVPASQIALRPVANLESVRDKVLTMKVLEVEKDRNNVVLSARAYLEEQLATAKEKVFANIKEGDLVDGRVTRLTNFGAFVDIGSGVEGLLHVSDISWNRIGHPGQVLKEGQELKVLVLNIDAERERISLGLKQTQDDPWTKVATKYPVGTVTDGRITRLTDFGAFVELEPGIEGLVHVSQISRERIEKPSDALKEGETVQVKVISLRLDQRRIGLSIREVEDEIPAEPRVANGKSKPKAKVEEPQGGVTIGDLVGDIFKQHDFSAQSEVKSDDSGTSAKKDDE